VTEKVTILMETDLADRLRREAARLDRPLAWICRRAILAGLRDLGQPDGVARGEAA